MKIIIFRKLDNHDFVLFLYVFEIYSPIMTIPKADLIQFPMSLVSISNDNNKYQIEKYYFKFYPRCMYSSEYLKSMI